MRNDSLLPEDCFIDFDFQLIDLFERMERSLLKIEDQVSEEYERVKYELGHRPSRVEFFTCMNEGTYLLVKSKAKLNPFKNYLAFLQKQNDLTDEEKTLMGTPASEFLTMIEKTSLSKTYKLPTFLAFIQNGSLQLQIDDDDLYRAFLDFYSKASNGVDLLRDKGTKDFKQWGKAEYVKLARKNPVHFLCQSESDFFSKDDQFVYLPAHLKPYQNHPEFIAHVKDAIDLRTQEFYKTRLEKLKG